MARRERRRDQALARKGMRVGGSRGAPHPYVRICRGAPGRKALLLGTRRELLLGARRELLLSSVIVSAAFLGAVPAPTPAAAQVLCTQPASPLPIADSSATDPILCVNTEPRTNAAGDAIDLFTNGDGNFIILDSDGLLQSTNGAGNANGIRTLTNGVSSFTVVVNRGDIDPVIATGGDAFGINARTFGPDSPVLTVNSGDFRVEASGGDLTYALGIYGFTNGGDSPLAIANKGNFRVEATGGVFTDAFGIYGSTNGGSSPLDIANKGNFRVEATGGDATRAYGILGLKFRGDDSPTGIHNSGDFWVAASGGSQSYAFGIYGFTGGGGGNPLVITNTGNFWVEATGDGDDDDAIKAFGISGVTVGNGNSVEIHNSGDFYVAAASDSSSDSAYAYGINAVTIEPDSPVHVDNSGDFWVRAEGVDARAHGIRAFTEKVGTNAIAVRNGGDFLVETEGEGSRAYGIRATTRDPYIPVSVDNSGDLWVKSDGDDTRAYGIKTETRDANSPTHIENSGNFWVETAGDDTRAYGINAQADAPYSPIHIENSGDFEVAASGGDNTRAFGVRGFTNGEDSPLGIHNSGDFWVEVTGGDLTRTFGIYGFTNGEDSPLDIHNSGDFWVEASGVSDTRAVGIYGFTTNDGSPLDIHNSGDFDVKASGGSFTRTLGIYGFTTDDGSPVGIRNSGDFHVRSTGGSFTTTFGIYGFTVGDDGPLSITNHGDFLVTTSGGYDADAYGIRGFTSEENSPVFVSNSGDMTVLSRGNTGTTAKGISSFTSKDDSGVFIKNSGDFKVATANVASTLYQRSYAFGIDADTSGPNSPIAIWNSGDFDVRTAGDETDAYGINAQANGPNSPIAILTHGDIHVEAKGESKAFGINARTEGENSPIHIENHGSVFATGGYRNVGVYAYSRYDNPTTIKNAGSISAGSHRAIDVKGAGTAEIYNEGTITGFVDLTDQDDVFKNEFGGVFEAKQTSLFGDGDDLFDNQRGGTVQAATNGKKSETTRFVHLETFKNAGTISMRDNRAGDRFIISNTPGGTDLDYKGEKGTLAVDSFLGGPGSKSDLFVIEGDVSGKTYIDVFNSNPNGGAFNDEGIPVVHADGATPDPKAFRLAGAPIDAGLFDYDLFFEERNSGVWELRSFPGAGAHVLPQLLTAAQDIWHQSSSTWFDRTADLRVLLNNDVPLASTGDKTIAAPVAPKFTPAAWLKTGGQYLDRDANAQTKAYGRTYNYNLDRELESFDVQAGIDFGGRDIWGADAVVFGVLGGFVYGDLSYDNLARNFDYSGGQVGAYATYLNGGLFVDTLLNVHIYDIDTSARGYPGSIDGNTVGLRTDAGYRFGSFTQGMFIEPLATLEVMWVDLDGYTDGGNRVSFSDDANVRGRLGLRAGTSGQFMENVLWEPFVIGSVWGNLDDSNSATVVSTGRTFRFVDDPEDVWGEVSAGVNFFNLSKSISVFSKIDVSFGDDLTGVGGQGGMRVAW